MGREDFHALPELRVLTERYSLAAGRIAKAAIVSRSSGSTG